MEIGAVEREYPYRNRSPLVVLFCAWSLAAASLLWAELDQGPFKGRDGRVTVEPATASVVRWVIFGLCGVFALVASRWIWIDRYQRRRLALTSHGILVPRSRWGWFSEEVFIRYDDITNCRLTVVKHLGAKDGVTRLDFRGSDGRFAIIRDQLPEAAFDEVCALLQARIEAAQQGYLA